MFYYYGRKKQIARYYPAPNFDIIVEPFAGAAAYSLFDKNWEKEVYLIEKDKKVAAIWEWLIKSATQESIKSLPGLKVGERSSEFLHIVHAATKMAFQYKTIKVTPVLERNWEISKRVMEKNLFKIKHWKILCGDFSEAPDLEATWFIDPPYKNDPGDGYFHGSKKIDYGFLASWAMERKGEIIFCEGRDGDYLPFEPLLELKGVAGKSSREVVYYRSSVPVRQPSLFG